MTMLMTTIVHSMKINDEFNCAALESRTPRVEEEWAENFSSAAAAAANFLALLSSDHFECQAEGRQPLGATTRRARTDFLPINWAE